MAWFVPSRSALSRWPGAFSIIRAMSAADGFMCAVTSPTATRPEAWSWFCLSFVALPWGLGAWPKAMSKRRVACKGGPDSDV